MRSFADIPAEVRRRVAAGERVGLVLLDALGRELLADHADHPIHERLEITPLRTQFPSTTTAHVTTLHLGTPVTDHGLYEWNVLEPALGEIICPLRFQPAQRDEPGGLAIDPAVLLGDTTFYETLEAESLVLQPRPLEESTYTRAATRGARRAGFERFADGVRAMRDALLPDGPCRYVLLYWDRIDATGHRHGPRSERWNAAVREALDALHVELTAATARGITVLLCADHGQVAVAPERVDYLEDAWPQLPARLAQPVPAGSARDAFLHVRDGCVDEVLEELGTRLGERATVRPARELFDDAGPRLRARLGDVVVLPAAGREVWMRSAPGPEQTFLGHHGGLEPVETATYLAQLNLD